MSKYKICAYAICKNEADFVDRWVESLSEADSIIVCDTGSTDDTVIKLRDKGVTVYEIKVDPWRFDVARNISMALIPSDVDICICTDLDEVMEPGWRKWLEKAWTPSTDCLYFMFTFSFNKDGSRGTTFWKNKIHSRRGYRWTRPIHEILEFQEYRRENVVYEENIRLNHFPKLKESRNSYLLLLEQAVKEAPHDDRNVHYLGREYLYHQRWDDCIRALRNHLSMPSATWREERSASMRYIAMAYQAKNNLTEAKNWLYRAIGEAPHLREPYVELTRVFYEEKNWPGVYHMVKEALKISKKSSTYINEASSWDYTLYDFGALSAFELGRYEEALDFAESAVKMAPDNERLRYNRDYISQYVNSTQGLIGFGASETAVLVGGVIDTTGLVNVAFSMPREGTITEIAAFFSVGASVSLVGSEVTIFAQLYESSAPDNIFSPIPGAIVTLGPPLTGLVNVGTVVSGITTGLNIVVPAESRLLMVFSAAVTGGIDIATIISGFASAGVNIV